MAIALHKAASTHINTNKVIWPDLYQCYDCVWIHFIGYIMIMLCKHVSSGVIAMLEHKVVNECQPWQYTLILGHSSSQMLL